MKRPIKKALRVWRNLNSGELIAIPADGELQGEPTWECAMDIGSSGVIGIDECVDGPPIKPAGEKMEVQYSGFTIVVPASAVG